MGENNAIPGTGICDLDLIRKGGGWKNGDLPLQPRRATKLRLEWDHQRDARQSPTPRKLSTGAINDGAWHEISCQRTASGEALLVDGQLLASSAVNVGSIKNTAHVVVGAQEKGIDFYQGLMDDTSFTVG